MIVRVFFASASKPRCRIPIETEAAGIEIRMLARQDDRRGKPALGERMGDRGKLDGFRPGPDDQPNLRGTQPSP